MSKLYEKIAAFQKENFIYYSDWHKDTHHVIISIQDEKYNDVSLIKTLDINLTTEIVTYTTTKDPKKALLFSSKISTMLYHYLSKISDIKNHGHYPIQKSIIPFANYPR